MFKSLSRFAAAAVVGATIVAGGVLTAPAANAATTKVSYPAFTGLIPVGSGYKESGYHNVRFTARHVGNETVKYEGKTAYRYYSIRIHRGKHDLLVVKKVSLKRAVYMGAVGEGLSTHNGYAAYRSDKALVKAEKQALQLPYKTVVSRVERLQRDAREAAVKSDVRSTVDNVATAQALGTPQDYVVATSNVKGTETVVVTFGDDNNFTVVGTDVYDHYAYRFDSNTGLFTGGKA